MKQNHIHNDFIVLPPSLFCVSVDQLFKHQLKYVICGTVWMPGSKVHKYQILNEQNLLPSLPADDSYQHVLHPEVWTIVAGPLKSISGTVCIGALKRVTQHYCCNAVRLDWHYYVILKGFCISAGRVKCIHVLTPNRSNSAPSWASPLLLLSLFFPPSNRDFLLQPLVCLSERTPALKPRLKDSFSRRTMPQCLNENALLCSGPDNELMLMVSLFSLSLSLPLASSVAWHLNTDWRMYRFVPRRATWASAQLYGFCCRLISCS